MNKKFLAGAMLLSAMGVLTACGSQQSYDMCWRAAVQQAEESKMQERFINVSASSEVKVAPDKANVYLGAEVSRGTAPLAENDVRKRASKLIEMLKDFGISESCIKTTDYSLYPRYEYVDDSKTLTGYWASMTVEVSGVDIEMISDVISKATEAGVNTVSGIEYTCSQYDELYADALADAISIAEVKAQRMADAAHVELGYAVSINEGYQNSASAYSMRSMACDTVADAGSAVAPGEIAIEASVSVAYSLGDEIESAECVEATGEMKVRVDDTGKQVDVYLESVEEDEKDELPAEEDYSNWGYESEQQDVEESVNVETNVYKDIEVNVVGPDDSDVAVEVEEDIKETAEEIETEEEADSKKMDAIRNRSKAIRRTHDRTELDESTESN